mmetsp:Transcript_1/g.6  ORF Transcript_1/g.6 Transcript_1/m.6 type:complete len:235 (-) Transcript_1:529-1233(-)
MTMRRRCQDKCTMQERRTRLDPLLLWMRPRMLMKLRPLGRKEKAPPFLPQVPRIASQARTTRLGQSQPGARKGRLERRIEARAQRVVCVAPEMGRKAQEGRSPMKQSWRKQRCQITEATLPRTAHALARPRSTAGRAERAAECPRPLSREQRTIASRRLTATMPTAPRLASQRLRRRRAPIALARGGPPVAKAIQPSRTLMTSRAWALWILRRCSNCSAKKSGHKRLRRRTSSC